jgi:tetratricopeptide (TPR) repeat protein
MRKSRFALALVVFVFCGLAALGPSPQEPVSGTSPFLGRWLILMDSPPNAPEPFVIIQVDSAASGLAAKLIATTLPAGAPITVKDVSEKDGQLTFVLAISGMGQSMEVKFQGKKVTDHLEGTADITYGPSLKWTGQATTKDSIEQPADEKAFEAATRKPPAERTEALRQFLKDYPDSQLKEQAHYQLALAIQNPEEKKAALLKFLADFPQTRIKDQAEYQLLMMITDPAERRKAQEKFVKDYPKSGYAGTVYLTLLDESLRAKPVDEAKVNETIDGFIGLAPEANGPQGAYGNMMRANTLNTIADRLMVNEVLLDKALNLSQQAVALMEKAPPQFPQTAQLKAMCQTTLGQVYFKRKELDQAEKELKKAVEIAGGQADAETYLYLGKVYEARNNDDAALETYIKAASAGSSSEIKESLERAYRKKYGNLEGLEEKLDAIYLARPKPFDPGHYSATGKESGRVVLAELFTGSECPPCVASDMAFDGLGERYDRNTVAVLVYHLHIPGPDPMTNPDTESRAKYYGIGSTPSVVFDGVDKNVGGGGAAQSPTIFNNYKGKVESRFSKPPLAVFSDLKAKLDGQIVTVTGQVQLAPEGAGKVEKAKLRIALVQDTVRYMGGNGVRFHNFVVRKLLGTPEGKPLEKPGTELSFTESVDIATLGNDQREYLTKFETERGQKYRPGFKFPDKLDRIDPAHLLIIAFVQDDETKEILQARFVKPSS